MLHTHEATGSSPVVSTNKKTTFVYQDKGGFFERCVPQAERDGVMCPSDVMCAPRVKATLAEHITSLCGEAAKHHHGVSHNITVPKAQLH